MKPMNLFREEGTCFETKADWDGRDSAKITLEREYDDWHEKNKVEDVYLQIQSYGSPVTLKGREKLRKLANTILAEIKRDEQQN